LPKHEQYKKIRNRCLFLQREDSKKSCLVKFNSLHHPNDVWKAAKALIKPKASEKLQIRVDDKVVQEEAEVYICIYVLMYSQINN
jgi:hypothetical protein